MKITFKRRTGGWKALSNGITIGEGFPALSNGITIARIHHVYFRRTRTVLSLTGSPASPERVYQIQKSKKQIEVFERGHLLAICRFQYAKGAGRCAPSSLIRPPMPQSIHITLDQITYTLEQDSSHRITLIREDEICAFINGLLTRTARRIESFSPLPVQHLLILYVLGCYMVREDDVTPYLV